MLEENKNKDRIKLKPHSYKKIFLLGIFSILSLTIVIAESFSIIPK